MPGRDGSGPVGRGAMTGRGLGYCTGVLAARYGVGRRLGYGMGYGRGYRRYCVPESIGPRDQREFLEEEKELLENRLSALNKQLEKIDSEE